MRRFRAAVLLLLLPFLASFGSRQQADYGGMFDKKRQALPLAIATSEPAVPDWRPLAAAQFQEQSSSSLPSFLSESAHTVRTAGGRGCGRMTLPSLLGEVTVGPPPGVTFRGLIMGNCPINAAMLRINDRPNAFGPLNF